MFRTLVALAVVFGLVVADPIARDSESKDSQLLDFVEDENTKIEPVNILPDKFVLLLEVLTKIIGAKVSALAIAVGTIEWLIKNAVMIITGAVVALGFCKITGKCSLVYEELIPVAELKSFVTPERLETAERFLVSAVEKYAQKKQRKSLW